MNLGFKFIGLIVAIIFLNMASTAWGQPDEEESVLAPLLFPESADWLDVRTLPQVSAEQLKELAPRLKELLADLTARREFYAVNCPLANHIFEVACCFYSMDANGDGLDDIIYSGYLYCGELVVNIIWYAEAQGGYSIKADDLNEGFLLRLKPAPEGALTLSYVPGCCGGFINTYCLDIPGEPRRPCAHTFRRDLNGLELIKNQMLNKRIRFKDWVELRHSPAVQDEYDAGYSFGLGYVFVGNILTIISSYDRKNPCRGTLLAYDPSGEWALVVLDAPALEHQEFSVSKGDFVRVGWVKAEAFELEP